MSAAKTAPESSLVFTNFVDFDMLYGHRRDTKGYATALEYFDTRLPNFIKIMKEDDIAIITADHGNDPTFKGTDHTREQVPVLMFGKKLKSKNLGLRKTFADIGQTAAHILGLKLEQGESFL